jgi:hypothetical protein
MSSLNTQQWSSRSLLLLKSEQGQMNECCTLRRGADGASLYGVSICGSGKEYCY